MQKIAPCLWFDNQAEEAAAFYVSIFKNSRVVEVARYGEAGPRESGSVMTVTFELDGQQFMALNGGPEYHFTPAISLFVRCETQAQVDELWERFLEGGTEVQCGWITDRFGVSWQIVPAVLETLLGDKDPERSQRVMRAMLGMKKLDVAALQAAREG